jgi:hypothetical protein
MGRDFAPVVRNFSEVCKCLQDAQILHATALGRARRMFSRSEEVGALESSR